MARQWYEHNDEDDDADTGDDKNAAADDGDEDNAGLVASQVCIAHAGPCIVHASLPAIFN
jgi:hypothetical protein